VVESGGKWRGASDSNQLLLKIMFLITEEG
jgi:hypothetical protein